ncbi:MAG: dienelactone hydrolase family protein [Cytophagales bacterium]|jgi:phospholipase/carboxylesterase|nr:dienelactone hydrolase family protein [Cytophagales bacterium]
MTHQADNYLTAGTPLAEADRAMILVHGRGADAQGILGLAPHLAQPGLAFVAPQATGNTWYPYSFLVPIAQNEPYLSSALAVLEATVQRLRDAGFPSEKVYLLGFSQGACLSLEFAARHAVRYGGVFGLSGGLIGPAGTPRNYAGSFSGTPIFLGCSDADSHIPKERVLETAEVMERMGAAVTTRLYPNMPHTINEDEIKAVNTILNSEL